MKSSKIALQQLHDAALDLSTVATLLKSTPAQKVSRKDRERLTDAVMQTLVAVKGVVACKRYINLKQLEALISKHE